jgi:predicted MFS family arabinose efflux permease
MPMRIAILFAFAQLAGAASRLLAFAISYLNGKAGLAGWRYLFILEGAPAVLCAIFAMFFLPNGGRQVPDRAREACRFAQASCDAAQL